MNVRSILIPLFTVLFLIAFESNGALPQECDSEPEYSLTDSVKAFCYTHRKKIIVAATLLVISTIALYHQAAIVRLLHNPQTTTSANKTRPSPQPELQGIDCPYNDRVKIVNVKTLRQPNGTECHHQAMFNCMRFNEHLNKNNGSPEGYLSTINRDQFSAYVNDYLKNMAALKYIPNPIAWFFCGKIINLNKAYHPKLLLRMTTLLNANNSIYPWANKIVHLFENDKIPSVDEFRKAVTQANINRWAIEICTDRFPSLQSPNDALGIEQITQEDVAQIARTIKHNLLEMSDKCQQDAFLHYHFIHTYQLDMANQLPSTSNTSFVYDSYKVLSYSRRASDKHWANDARPNNYKNIARNLPIGDRHSFLIRRGSPDPLIKDGHWYLAVMENNDSQYALHILDSLGTKHNPAEEEIKAIIETFCTPGG